MSGGQISMAILKCKICGGDMEVSPDKTFGTCEYCGSSMTLPKISDEQRAALFNRGNHFRRSGEFDKALAIYENVVAEMLVKSGYKLFFYRNEKSTVEMDFFVRDADSVVPIEVKATNNATASLNNLIEKEMYPEIKYGIKFCEKNIGFNGKFYTFPYFLVFLLHRYMMEKIAK